MNTIELMDGSVSSFSKTDRAIYEALRKFPDMFATSSVTEIANGGGFSKPALTRFAQRLGFGGFVEFQYQLAADLAQRRARSGAPSHAEVYGNLLQTVDERLDRAQLQALVERMQASPCTYIMGYNLSRLPAEELNMALQLHPGIRSVFPQLDLMPRLNKEDLLIVYSALSGDSFKGLLRDIKSGRTGRPYMVLVTTSSKHPLRRSFDEVITLPTISLTDATHAVLSDTFAFLMFNDLLAGTLPLAGMR